MPVIKIFTADPVSPAHAEAVGADLESLCLDWLRADPSAIQIAFASALIIRGAPVLVEVHYRAQPHRDAAALAGFMEGVERSVSQHLGRTPRIRCFSVESASLSARN